MPTTHQPVKKRKSVRRGIISAKKSRNAKLKKKDLSASYNEFKEFGGKHYTGMQVGRSHHWHYDQGDWKETKITPDLWEVYYSVTKHRLGHAPEGSGVPTGTGYHCGIIRCMQSGWKMDGQKDKGFVKALGQEIFLWYE
jgi:hypothetical protein